MRREINIRKKKKLLLIESNKKILKAIALLCIILTICIFIYSFFIQNFFIKKNLEKDINKPYLFSEKVPFELNKIVLFSSATAKSKSVNKSLSLDISQYCDIGIYLNNIDKDNTSIKSLSIKNILSTTPELGTPYFYKKNIHDFGKCSFDEKDIIENEFYFNIAKNKNEINYNNYETSPDGSTPISLGFYNKNVKQEFITDKKEISYNGKLLKDALIPKTSLNTIISFEIYIITENSKEYTCNIEFEVPFENEDNLIYDTGYIKKELKDIKMYKFIRTK